MTPQERQLVSELFARLERLEGERRDPDAERAVAEGFDRAPNAAYALVQTVLVQDEALKRADAHIEELEAQLSGGAAPEARGGGFLDSMRGMMSGREGGRGSVPSVRSAHSPGEGSSGLWNTAGRSEYASGRGYYEPQPAAAPPQAGGGSFLGTAAATAAGVVGGALLMNSMRGMFGPSHGGQASSAFDPGLSSGGRAPGSGEAANSGLARDAGLGDIAGGGRSASYDGDRRAGLFGGDDAQDTDNDDSDDGDDGDDGDDFSDDVDGGDTDIA